MITYIYKKDENELVNQHVIVTSVKGTNYINSTDIIGTDGYAKGNDFEQLGYITISEELTKEVDGEMVPLESGDIIDTTTLIDLSRRIEILSELGDLDKIMDRKEEQIYFDMNKTPSYQPMVDTLLRKQVLRSELLELEV